MPTRTKKTAAELPLRSLTPPVWASQVLHDPIALLSDHAHLEKKAAANALDLIHRYPQTRSHDDDAYRDRWVKTLSVIAREESEHLALVIRLLHERGGQLSKHHRNQYAADLRQHVRLGAGSRDTIDRLMVSALIEVRSCERFGVLADNCDDPALAKLYSGLYASELGHYHIFIELARGLPGATEVESRWNEWLDIEANVIGAQAPTSSMHSGVKMG